MRVLFALTTALGLLACSKPLPPLPIPDACSALLFEVDCGLPYPSDAFLVDDPSMPTGKRIRVPAAGKLLTSQGQSGDVSDFWAPDGASRLPFILAAFGVPIDRGSAPDALADPAHTLEHGFPIALVEAESGARVPFFVDVDPRTDDGARQAFVIHPLTQLAARTRYVVAISGLTSQGMPVVAPVAFARLRDGTVSDADSALLPLRDRFDADVFAVAERAGLSRRDLQFAWDFTTGSDERAMHDLLRARSLALAELERTPPTVEVSALIEGEALEELLGGDTSELTWRVVRGTVTGPRVVEDDAPGALLVRDEEGEVVLHGSTSFDFTAVVPARLRAASAPTFAVGYGHGFFIKRAEVEGRAPRLLANEAGAVMFAIDWLGMSAADIGELVGNIGGPVSRTLAFGDRIMQAMVNWQTLMRAIKNGAFGGAAFTREGKGGAPLLDPSQPIGFVGMSAGHILGGTLAALTPELERVVLASGGAGFTHLMFRARPFAPFLLVLDASLPDRLDQQKAAALMQPQFDRFDPARYAGFVLGGTLPEGPDNGARDRRVLQIMGLGDTQVPNLGAEIHARLLGVPQLRPSAAPPVLGLASADMPHEGSGFMVYDFGIDPSFAADATPADAESVAHEGVQHLPQSIAQMGEFLRSGTIVNPCDGACVVSGSL